MPPRTVLHLMGAATMLQWMKGSGHRMLISIDYHSWYYLYGFVLLKISEVWLPNCGPEQSSHWKRWVCYFMYVSSRSWLEARIFIYDAWYSHQHLQLLNSDIEILCSGSTFICVKAKFTLEKEASGLSKLYTLVFVASNYLVEDFSEKLCFTVFCVLCNLGVYERF